MLRVGGLLLDRVKSQISKCAQITQKPTSDWLQLAEMTIVTFPVIWTYPSIPMHPYASPIYRRKLIFQTLLREWGAVGGMVEFPPRRVVLAPPPPKSSVPQFPKTQQWMDPQKNMGEQGTLMLGPWEDFCYYQFLDLNTANVKCNPCPKKKQMSFQANIFRPVLQNSYCWWFRNPAITSWSWQFFPHL